MSGPSFGRLATVSLFLASLLLIVFGEVGATEESTASKERTADGVVGASIVHPEGWTTERERYTLERTYGFTLWRPENGPQDDGGMPAVRVALAYNLKPEQIEATVRDKLEAYPDLPMSRETVGVGRNGIRGVAVGPIPGSTPSTEVYAPVNGRVYQINVYGAKLDDAGRELLSSIRFFPPSRSVGALGLPDANSPKALHKLGDEARLEREQAIREAAAKGSSETAFNATAGPRTGETRIAEGCWRADPSFFVQTQFGPRANSRPGDGIRTGYSIIGLPNYWDEYTHGALGRGYGRCTAPYNTNDKFAVDYPLNLGNSVFSPFGCGHVTFAGRNRTHQDYGIFVSIKACNGKYVNLSGHLSALARGIRRGARVDRHTAIGFAGNTGGPIFPVGRVHLHQAFYRYPHYNPDGSPYGGAGLAIVRHRYFGQGGGIYSFGWTLTKRTRAKGSLISF